MSVTITSSSNDITVSCLAWDILFDDFDNGVKVNTGTVHLILWKNAMSVLFQRSLIVHTKKRTISGEDRSVTQLILQLLKRNHRSISDFNVYVLCRKPRNLRDLFEPLRAGYSQSWEGDSLTPKASITWATNDAWHTFLDWARDREASTIFVVKENVEKSRE